MSPDILVRICTASIYDLWDIMELLPENEDELKEQAESNPQGNENVGKPNS